MTDLRSVGARLSCSTLSWISSLQRSPLLKTTADWRREFLDFGLTAEGSFILSEYAGRLAERGLPVIFSFSHLARLLGKRPAYLSSVVFSAQNHYRNFCIPKKTGGTREICAPYPALLECQRWISRHILSRLPVEKAAHGYVSNRSAITNARVHAGQKCALKIDIKDFFPSVHINRLVGIFRSLGYAPEISFFLARICTLNDRLPQGAATSPTFSNLVFRHIDKRIAGLAKHHRLKYSRYADDIVISGDSIPKSIIGLISEMLSSSGFAINPKKLILLKDDRRKIITGIDASTADLRVPRAYRRTTRAQAHLAISQGALEYIAHQGRGPVVIDELVGKLQYWLSVEPQNPYAVHAIEQIKEMQRKFR